jgi:hypothetical protein
MDFSLVKSLCDSSVSLVLKLFEAFVPPHRSNKF